MSASLLFENNPFFRHELDKLCAICHRELEETKSESILQTIPKLEPSLTAFQVLKRFSNFNIENGPPNVCSTCFHNITSAYKFMLICNKAHEVIENYFEQKDNFTTIIENDCQPAEENIILVVAADSEDIKPETEPKTTPKASPKTSPKVAPKAKSKAKARKSLCPSSTRIKCEVCHKMYLQSYLTIHMRTHTGEKPFQCEICSKAFVSLDSLNLHQVSHTDIRPYICKYCGKRFKLLRTLRGHERIHTGERPYSCKICGKRFGVSNVLKNHYLVHTKEKRFQCETCHKGFGRKTHLTQHLISHDKVKKHECPLCGKRFTQAQSLRSHVKMSCQAQNFTVKTESPDDVEVVIKDDIDEDIYDDGLDDDFHGADDPLTIRI